MGSQDEKEFEDLQHLEVKEISDTPLPSPASAASPKPAKTKLSATAIIPVWIVLSSSVIIYNNYLLTTLEFKYPVFIVTWHLTFAAIGTRVLQRTTRLLDGTKDIHMSKDMFVRSILPIGVLFSGSLILSNTAYLYLSVSYIQMLKVCFIITTPILDSSLIYLLLLIRRSHLLPSFSSRGSRVSKNRTKNSPSLCS